MKNSFAQYLRNTRGMAAIEFALIMPMLMLLFFGMVDVTSLISVNRQVTYASGVMADLVTQNKNVVLKTDLEDYRNAVFMIIGNTPTADIGVEFYGLTKTYNASATNQGSTSWDDKYTASVAWSVKSSNSVCGSNTAPATTTPTAENINTNYSALMGANSLNDTTKYNDLVLARVCVNFKPWIFTLFGKKIMPSQTMKLTQDTIQRPRASMKLGCQLTASNTAACTNLANP